MRITKTASVLGAMGLALPAFAQQPAPAAAPLQTIPVEPLRSEPVVEAETNWTVKTAGGLSVESSDGANSFNLDGRLQFDTMYFDGVYSNSVDGEGSSDTTIRRSRLGVNGVLDRDWTFEIIFDVKDDKKQASIDTAEFSYRGFDFADITCGRFKRPFFLEEITTSKWVTTVERSLISDITINNTAQFGGMLSNKLESDGLGVLTWAIAMVDDQIEDGTKDDQYGYYGRVTWAPVAEKTSVLHFGLAYGDRNLPDNYPVTLTSGLAVSAADTQTLLEVEADGDSQVGAEAAWLAGPLSLQAEYVVRTIDAADGSVDASGYYAQVTYTLTGESRTYKTYPAKFDKLVPANGKYGAIELVAKYDSIEVEQPGAASAEAELWTLGVNWYLTRYLHLKLNYLDATTDNVAATGTESDGSAWTSRIAFAF